MNRVRDIAGMAALLVFTFAFIGVAGYIGVVESTFQCDCPVIVDVINHRNGCQTRVLHTEHQPGCRRYRAR